MTTFTPGTRVVVQSPGWVAGQTGTVIEMAKRLLNGHDCCVRLDGDDREQWPLCFYAHELAVAK